MADWQGRSGLGEAVVDWQGGSGHDEAVMAEECPW